MPRDANLSDDERARRIRRFIRHGDKTLLARHPMLGHQDAIGALLCALSASAMVGLGCLYWAGWIPWYLCLFGGAFFASILHEIEHDLIHFLYFRGRPLAHNLMMLVVWVFRGNIIHGWRRRALHFHHHRVSGTRSDVEERLIGLGMPWGVKRLLVMVDGTAAFLFNARRLQKENPGFRRLPLALAALPIYPVFVLVLVGFLLLRLPYSHSAWLLALGPVIDVLAVSWVFPNYLRHACLSIVSSNVHYYEDVENVHSETQVLRPFYLWPLQLFCFNFGTTHALHHYVVEQPFYVRQLIAPMVLPALRKYGVRFNDAGTFLRANRFRRATATA